MKTAVQCCCSSMWVPQPVQGFDKYSDKDVARMHLSQSQSSTWMPFYKAPVDSSSYAEDSAARWMCIKSKVRG